MSTIRKETVENYSKRNSGHYDDPTNKNFLYGKKTEEFVKNITFNNQEKVVLDVGCGTGFVFDILGKKINDKKINFIGVEPAEGMLDVAKKKYSDFENVEFKVGTFSEIPLDDNSVDKITSTLALHWVPSIESSLKEIKRVLKQNGSLDIMLTEKDDGASFKNPIILAMKKHLNFKQIMNAATLSQRLSTTHMRDHLLEFFDENDYVINVENVKQKIFGNFDEHMKWWKSRSEQIISEIENKDSFLIDLKVELEKINTKNGIPFDLSLLNINIKKK